jgi:hypothetical protein
MLRVLFDKNVPYLLRLHLTDYQVQTADDEGWRACFGRRRRSLGTKKTCRATSGNPCPRRRSAERCGSWTSCGSRRTRRRPRGGSNAASHRTETGWRPRRALSRTLSGHHGLRPTAQAGGCYPAVARPHPPTAEAFGSHASFHERVAAASGAAPVEGQPDRPHPHFRQAGGIKTKKERRAKTARRSSRFIYPKTAARGLHQSRSVPKTKTPRTGIFWPGLTGGLAPSASEPAPSQRSSDLPQRARLLRNIVTPLTPPLRSNLQKRTFLSGRE